MPLTPEEVQQKRFSTVRFKEGYDEVEVDAFLDEVTAELSPTGRPDSRVRGSPYRRRIGGDHRHADGVPRRCLVRSRPAILPWCPGPSVSGRKPKATRMRSRLS